VTRGRHQIAASTAMLAALATVGCGGSGTSTSSSAGKTSVGESAKSAESVQTVPQLPARAKSSNGAGFGATEAAWTAAHTPDNEFAERSAYDRDPSLADVEGHTGARYTAVGHEGGRITGYAYHFPSAPIAVAKRHVLSSQFPADAHEVAFAVEPTCAVMIVRSATLQRQLSPIVGHPAEGTFVEFRSGPEEISYDASAVTTAILAPTASKNPADVVC
jgi:hypothetical protein